MCGGTCDQDDNDDGICDYLQVEGCTNPAACNFMVYIDDGSCFYATLGYDCAFKFDDGGAHVVFKATITPPTTMGIGAWCRLRHHRDVRLRVCLFHPLCVQLRRRCNTWCSNSAISPARTMVQLRRDIKCTDPAHGCATDGDGVNVFRAFGVCGGCARATSTSRGVHEFLVGGGRRHARRRHVHVARIWACEGDVTGDGFVNVSDI